MQLASELNLALELIEVSVVGVVDCAAAAPKIAMLMIAIVKHFDIDSFKWVMKILVSKKLSTLMNFIKNIMIKNGYSPIRFNLFTDILIHLTRNWLDFLQVFFHTDLCHRL